MAPKNRIIIDTDPGVDDVLAILLALSSPASELETLLISVTHGNVDVQSCLRNVVSVFHILNQELAWRKSHNLKPGFEGITKFKPLVAVGADAPLEDAPTESADYFHGIDGLAGIHVSHPHLSPAEGWKRLFEEEQQNHDHDQHHDAAPPHHSFTPSLQPSHKEILRLLRENEAGTITLIALGPCTNYALAAAEDPETFLRCKEVVLMGGVVEGPGNVTPVAEFNVYADPYATAAVFALTSPQPWSTMPVPLTGATSESLPPYPQPGPAKQLAVRLMALDITERHVLSRGQVREATAPLIARGSPLAHWLNTFMTPILDKMERLHEGHAGDVTNLALHDPLCVYYVLTQDWAGWEASAKSPEDVRVETRGQWSRGMTVGDRRGRKRRDSDGEAPHDRGNWLGRKSGNRIIRMVRSGKEGVMVGTEIMDSIFTC
ncbi:hypothetical protein DV736_g4702, partial [Chaetothyriales sp. CBS 134916]